MLSFAITRFLMAYIALSILVGILNYFIDAGTGVSGIILFMAPYFTGMFWYNKFQQIPEKNFSWKCAAYFAIIGFLLNGTLLFLLLELPEIQKVTSEIGQSFFWIALVILSLIQFLVARWAFSYGARQAEKAKMRAIQYQKKKDG